MLLPVISTKPVSSRTDLIRLFHQAQLQWFSHLGDETVLDYGRWIASAGCLLDAFLLPDLDADQLIRQTNELAETQFSTWQSCSLNPSMPIDKTFPLAEALTASGWKLDPLDVVYRQQKSLLPPIDIANLIIIPARASYRHFTQLMLECGEPDLALQHLDDSHLDALLALQNGKAVGCIEVLTSGQVATVRQWYVSPPRRGLGIGRLLLQRAVEICDRAVLPHVMIGIKPTATTAHHLAQSTGFAEIGKWLNYSRNV